MKYIIIFLTFLFVFANAAEANNNNVTLFMCEGCNYDEAYQLAKDNPPLTQCYSSDPNEIITIDNQACYSNPKKVIVADVLGNGHFAFMVGHHHQGSNMPLLNKYAEPTSLSNNDETAISRLKTTDKNFSKFIKEMQAELNVSPLQVSQHLPLNMIHSNTENSCPPHITDAVKAVFEGRTASELQHKLNNKAKADFEDPERFFHAKEYSSEGFSIGVGGISYQGTWKKVSKNFNTSVRFNQNQDIPTGSTGLYDVVFSIKWIREFGALSVSVNPFLTYLDGIALNQLQKTTSNTVDQCLQDALDHTLPSNTSSPSPGGGSSGGGSSGGGSSGGGSSGGGGWDNQVCEKHYYINGVKMLTIKVSC
ncbi:hypothetical protein J5X91_10910 [Pseudoalteromonas sp. K222D]|uniref:hypothetical protein n=2 Tax=Pseudoalteromonas TaxID=53246 RepID=UPI001AD7CEBE|nr:hypothetical protein [Pseudoalteromonas sp. K222D]MBO7926772.1 hypothetical protein [Pseudoalteromonas sp. K222D]